MILGDSLSLLDLGSQGLHTANTKSPTAFFQLPISQGKAFISHTHTTHTFICMHIIIHTQYTLIYTHTLIDSLRTSTPFS